MQTGKTQQPYPADATSRERGAVRSGPVALPLASNPVNISIPAGSQGAITCVANAGFFQRVTLEWTGSKVIFQGTGEGLPMQTPDGQDSYLLMPESLPYQISATFEYSVESPNGPFQPAAVRNPVITGKGDFTVIEVTSEDSTDNDNNDSYLTIVLVQAYSEPESSAGKSKANFSQNLSLHAKTYYNDPYVEGGDEHYITIPSFVEQVGNVSYAGTSEVASKSVEMS